MTQHLARIVSLLCTVWLIVAPVGALYLLLDHAAFTTMVRAEQQLPVQWHTVGTSQLYVVWLLAVIDVGLGTLGILFLRRAFQSFARGEWFDESNSRDLRRYAALLVAQALARPIVGALTSVVLSLNHPPGERMLSLTFGSNELWYLLAGFVTWVLADLLVRGASADRENRQFV
ncbi:MAG: hypothetical protein AAF749_11540 [Pseudomonadota bacterium]